MKKVVNVGIGGKGFILDIDAYNKLDNYLGQFRSKISMGADQAKDVMDDLEARITELFSERLGTYKDVVDINLVDMVICQLGMPDGSEFVENNTANNQYSTYNNYEQQGIRKFYRDSVNKSIGGVCSGLAIYFSLDTALVRVLFVVCFFMGLASFWVYIILWLVAPLAVTPAQKCEMYGLPVTPENLSKFSN